MNSEQLLAKALSREEPWLIEHVEFSSEKRRLDVYISFKRGSTFFAPELDVEGEYKAYDTLKKTWRHLNFFQHEWNDHCRTPRIKTGSNQIRLVSPPWGGRSNGFTLLFEALVLQLCSQMTILAGTRLINESDDKIWRMLDSYVEEARLLKNFESVEKIGIDETSKTKGHDYITILAALSQKRTLFVTEGKDHSTVERFVEDLKNPHGNPEQIKQVSCDMSPSFLKGVNDNFENAEITFAKFHLVKLINEAVDEVRKQEVKTQPVLQKTKSIF
jgi:transposase